MRIKTSRFLSEWSMATTAALLIVLQLSGCGPSGGSGDSDREKAQALLPGNWMTVLGEDAIDAYYSVIRIDSSLNVVYEGFDETKNGAEESFYTVPGGKVSFDQQNIGTLPCEQVCLNYLKDRGVSDEGLESASKGTRFQLSLDEPLKLHRVSENSEVNKAVPLVKVTEQEIAIRKEKYIHSLRLKQTEIVEIEKMLINKSLVLEKKVYTFFSQNDENQSSTVEEASSLSDEATSTNASGETTSHPIAKRLRFLANKQVLVNDKLECTLSYTKPTPESPTEVQILCPNGDHQFQVAEGVVTEGNGKIIFTSVYKYTDQTSGDSRKTKTEMHYFIK